ITGSARCWPQNRSGAETGRPCTVYRSRSLRVPHTDTYGQGDSRDGQRRGPRLPRVPQRFDVDLHHVLVLPVVGMERKRVVVAVIDLVQDLEIVGSGFTTQILLGLGGDVTAAIYARKSTDQSGVADEAKSVRRQIDH